MKKNRFIACYIFFTGIMLVSVVGSEIIWDVFDFSHTMNHPILPDLLYHILSIIYFPYAVFATLLNLPFALLLPELWGMYLIPALVVAVGVGTLLHGRFQPRAIVLSLCHVVHAGLFLYLSFHGLMSV
ncbi:MAG: hypothetical protein IJF36_03035 [Oscillibacter sp.]|nr:hypothetical protein [Oscillibacter sp.]